MYWRSLRFKLRNWKSKIMLMHSKIKMVVLDSISTAPCSSCATPVVTGTAVAWWAVMGWVAISMMVPPNVQGWEDLGHTVLDCHLTMLPTPPLSTAPFVWGTATSSWAVRIPGATSIVLASNVQWWQDFNHNILTGHLLSQSRVKLSGLNFLSSHLFMLLTPILSSTPVELGTATGSWAVGVAGAFSIVLASNVQRWQDIWDSIDRGHLGLGLAPCLYQGHANPQKHEAVSHNDVLSQK